jgi:hypothetical protein
MINKRGLPNVNIERFLALGLLDGASVALAVQGREFV